MSFNAPSACVCERGREREREREREKERERASCVYNKFQSCTDKITSTYNATIEIGAALNLWQNVGGNFKEPVASVRHNNNIPCGSSYNSKKNNNLNCIWPELEGDNL